MATSFILKGHIGTGAFVGFFHVIHNEQIEFTAA